MNKLKFCIVGCGNISKRHAENITRIGELLAVCDIDAEKAKSLSDTFKSKFYSDYEEMLSCEKNSDFIVICTPNGLHANHSILALKYGYNVLCEKPLGLNTYECGEMIKIAEKNNKRLFAVKQNRFNPPIVALKEIIDNNKLGKLSFVQLNCFWNRDINYYKNSWKGSKALDGGTLYTQFSHFIDLLYWLIGDIVYVNSLTSNHFHNEIIEFEDAGVSIVKFQNGVIGSINFTINSYKKNMEGSITIFGENGTIKIGGQYLNEIEYQFIKDVEIKNLPIGNKPNDYGTYVGSMSNHDKVYNNLQEVMINGASINTNMFEAFKVVEIIEKIYKSVK
jgi:UDP-N-acetyl-2-amino-2-deoxyglucuronate dehydrogenase